MATPFTAFDSTPISISQKALAENFGLEEKERREAAVKNKDFYYGKQETELILMNEQYQLPIILNLTKPILTKRTSMLYQRPLVRDWDGPQASIDFLEQVYKDNSIDSLLKKVDLYSELTGSVLLHPSLDESLPSQIRLVMYDASQFSVVGSDADSTTADAISLIRVVDRLVDGAPVSSDGRRQPQIEKVILQQIWTVNTITVYEGANVVGTIENPLGFLPFVNFQGEEVHEQYIGFPVATIVRKLNTTINQMLTDLGYMVKMQAHTPIAFSGFKSGESVVVHPGRAINLPSDATAQVLSLDPKIQDTLDTITYLEDRLYTTSSVPKISVEGGEGESGRELLVRWFPLMQVFQEKTVRYTRYELQLANMILAIANLEPVDDLKIDWPEEQVLPLSVEDDNLDRDIKLNIKSPIDEIMRRNPQMDEDEAEDEYKKNIEQNREASNGTQEEGGAEQSSTGTPNGEGTDPRESGEQR